MNSVVENQAIQEWFDELSLDLIMDCVSFIEEKFESDDLTDFTPDWNSHYLQEMNTSVFPDRLIRDFKYVIGIPIWLCKYVDKNDPDAKAVYNGVTIRMLKDMPQALKTHVLLHEWAHVLLHSDELGEIMTPEKTEAFLALAEVEAELTTTLVQRALGNDPWEYSKLYISDWWIEHVLSTDAPIDIDRLKERVVLGANQMMQLLVDANIVDLNQDIF